MKTFLSYWQCWGGFLAMMFYIFRDDIHMPSRVDGVVGVFAAWTLGNLIGKCLFLQSTRDNERKARLDRWEAL